MNREQNRGNHPTTQRAVRSYLSVQPESTNAEIVKGTGLARQTVAHVLERIAVPVEGTWP